MKSYNDLKIANEFLHFSKTGYNSFSGIIEDNLVDCKYWCPFSHGPKTDSKCYETNPALSDLFLLLKKYVCCFEYLEIDVYGLKSLNDKIGELKNPQANYELKAFKENLKSFLDEVKYYEKKFYKLASSLTCEECIRLDEAINAFENYCYHSSVIMAVSTVEARLHYLIRAKNNSLYERYFKNATLGQIVKLLDPNEYRDVKFRSIKKQLPLKYKPLIEVLNIYRVFSAHPKIERIDFKTAQSVLNFSFAFLLSDEAKINSKKLLIHR